WSSDVCSSDLGLQLTVDDAGAGQAFSRVGLQQQRQLQATQVCAQALLAGSQIGDAGVEPEPAAQHSNLGALPVEPSLLESFQTAGILAAETQRAEGYSRVGLLQCQLGHLQAESLALQRQCQAGIEPAQFGAIEDATQPASIERGAGNERAAGGQVELPLRLQPAGIQLQKRRPVGQGRGQRIARTQEYFRQVRVQAGGRAWPVVSELQRQCQPAIVGQRPLQ